MSLPTLAKESRGLRPATTTKQINKHHHASSYLFHRPAPIWAAEVGYNTRQGRGWKSHSPGWFVARPRQGPRRTTWPIVNWLPSGLDIGVPVARFPSGPRRENMDAQSSSAVALDALGPRRREYSIHAFIIILLKPIWFEQILFSHPPTPSPGAPNTGVARGVRLQLV